MMEEKVKFDMKINNLGVKQLMVIGKLMIVLDC